MNDACQGNMAQQGRGLYSAENGTGLDDDLRKQVLEMQNLKNKLQSTPISIT